MYQDLSRVVNYSFVSCKIGEGRLYHMLGFDLLNVFRILSIINVGTERNLIHRYPSGYCYSFQGNELFGLGHNILKKIVYGHECGFVMVRTEL